MKLLLFITGLLRRSRFLYPRVLKIEVRKGGRVVIDSLIDGTSAEGTSVERDSEGNGLPILVHKPLLDTVCQLCQWSICPIPSDSFTILWENLRGHRTPSLLSTKETRVIPEFGRSITSRRYLFRSLMTCKGVFNKHIDFTQTYFPSRTTTVYRIVYKRGLRTSPGLPVSSKGSLYPNRKDLIELRFSTQNLNSFTRRWSLKTRWWLK